MQWRRWLRPAKETYTEAGVAKGLVISPAPSRQNGGLTKPILNDQNFRLGNRVVKNAMGQISLRARFVHEFPAARGQRFRRAQFWRRYRASGPVLQGWT